MTQILGLPILFLGLFSPLIAQAAGKPGCTDFLNTSIVDQIVEKRLPETEKLFQSLARKHPMATTEFVLVGRSPSLLAAYLEVQREMYPDLHSWVLPISLKNESSVSRAVLIERFTRIFNLFRPQEFKAAPPRKMVFIDFVSSGRTFKALDRLLAETEIEGELVGFSFESKLVEEDLKQLNLSSRSSVVEISREMDENVGDLKVVAPYSSHQIEFTEPSSETLNPEIKRKNYRDALLSIQQELFF